MNSILLPEENDWISLILKLPGETCNINCVYCYEKRKPYERNLVMNPDHVGKFLAMFENQPLSIELHGGEPLLIGKKKLKPILDVINAYKGQTKISIQTNGTLLDEEWVNFLLENCPNLEIGISLDGDSEINSYRIDYKEENSIKKVEKAIRLLEKKNIDIGIISVVTNRTINYSRKKFLDYFSEFSNIKSLKFAPCMDYNVQTKNKKVNKVALSQNDGYGHAGWAISPLEYSSFMNDIFNYWLDNGYYNNFTIEPALSIMRNLYGKHTSFCHFNDQKCNHVLTLYPDGRIGSCDELPIGLAYHTHIDEVFDVDDLIKKPINNRLSSTLSKIMEKCNSCSYYNICKGGCIATRQRYLNTEYDDEYCQHRISMIDNVKNKIEL